MKMKRPTKKQIEVLYRIAPGPLGLGMKPKIAAKNLGITRFAVHRRLETFKKNFPKAWGNFLKLKELAKQDKYELRWKRVKKQQIYLKTFTELAGDNEVSEFLDMLENKGELRRLL